MLVVFIGLGLNGEDKLCEFYREVDEKFKLVPRGHQLYRPARNVFMMGNIGKIYNAQVYPKVLKVLGLGTAVGEMTTPSKIDQWTTAQNDSLEVYEKRGGKIYLPLGKYGCAGLFLIADKLYIRFYKVIRLRELSLDDYIEFPATFGMADKVGGIYDLYYNGRKYRIGKNMRRYTESDFNKFHRRRQDVLIRNRKKCPTRYSLKENT